MFITFDGVDGAGKTSLITALAESLEDMGYDVHVFHFPMSDDVGEGLTGEKKAKDFVADMGLGYRHVILPLLEEEDDKRIVLVDRYKWTTYAYNIHGVIQDQLELESWVRRLSFLLPDPDLSFYLTVDHDTAFFRKGEIELEDYTRVTEGYEKIHELGYIDHIIDGESTIKHNVGIVNTIIENAMRKATNE